MGPCVKSMDSAACATAGESALHTERPRIAARASMTSPAGRVTRPISYRHWSWRRTMGEMRTSFDASMDSAAWATAGNRARRPSP